MDEENTFKESTHPLQWRQGFRAVNNTTKEVTETTITFQQFNTLHTHIQALEKLVTLFGDYIDTTKLWRLGSEDHQERSMYLQRIMWTAKNIARKEIHKHE